MSSPSNSHAGHRQRLRARFAENGFKGFHDYEILELMLFSAIPQKDTKPLAKRLLQTFGSLSRVLDAPVDETAKVEGCGVSIALFLQSLRSLFAAYSEDSVRQDAARLTTMSGLWSTCEQLSATG
jgi:DNA repair protein RadC